MAPSTNCTAEWTMLCGWTTTWICSSSTPKSHLASITSSPLLTSVEESMVTFRPMVQLGCFRASSGWICSSCCLLLPRKGPPEAVSRIFSMLRPPASPFNDWKMALCSLSTGKTATLCFSANGMIICPAVTSVSLFARAISFPASMAAMVGLIPIIPTMAVTNTWLWGKTAISSKPSMPERILTFVSETLARRSAAASSDHMHTARGWNSRICSSILSTLLPAARATACKSGLFRTISSVWVPMEPVEPKTAIFFICHSLYRRFMQIDSRLADFFSYKRIRIVRK